jgi:hypothetical protein
MNLATATFNNAVFKGLLLLLLFINFPPASPPIKKAANPADNFEHDENLQAETDALLPLFDQMPKVPVYLTEEPILKSGTNTETGAAYTHCYPREFPIVFVKKVFYQKANRIQLVNALKHELTHAWLCRQGLMSAGHNELFRRKFTEVGGFGN